MPKLNEHRIVKRRNWFFPFNYEMIGRQYIELNILMVGKSY